MTHLKTTREGVPAEEGLLMPTLYGYWRSSATWRLRIACEYKKINYVYHPINLLKSEESSAEYLKINPMGQVPSWVQPLAAKKADSAPESIVINQSLSVLEYLEETMPNAPALLPPVSDPLGRATVRDLALLIVSGIHPLQNNAIMGKVEKLAGGGNATKTAWAKDIITEGLVGFEFALQKANVLKGKFCYGDSFTLVDVCLIPQLYNAERFGVDLAQFPTISAIVQNYKELTFLAAAHPDAMPDATPV